jgi:hypothetical protein
MTAEGTVGAPTCLSRIFCWLTTNITANIIFMMPSEKREVLRRLTLEAHANDDFLRAKKSIARKIRRLI